MEIPVKPYPAGKLAATFGGPADSALDVLTRARAALSPRGAWSASGWTAKNQEGHGRCILQCFKDVDGIHVSKAELFMLKAINETTGKKWSGIIDFNDSPQTHKHHVIKALDRAIELAQK